jgi:hypothetical protein
LLPAEILTRVHLGIFRDRVSIQLDRPLIDEVKSAADLLSPTTMYSLPVVLARPVSFERILEVIKSFPFVDAPSLDHGFLVATGAKTISKAFAHPAKHLSIRAYEPGTLVSRLVRSGGGWLGTRPNGVLVKPDDLDGVRDAVEELLPWFEWKEFVPGDPDDGRVLFDPSTQKSPETGGNAGGGSVTGFGYKCAWLAVKGNDLDEVVSVVLDGAQTETTQAALDASERGFAVCVGPVDGWVLVKIDVADIGVAPLGLLSQRFGEAQLFMNFRGSDSYGWQRWADGRMVRSWASDGSFSDVGKRTPIEVELGDLDDEDEGVDEDSVLRVAAAWSIDPSAMGDTDEVPFASGPLRIQ